MTGESDGSVRTRLHLFFSFSLCPEVCLLITSGEVN